MVKQSPPNSSFHMRRRSEDEDANPRLAKKHRTRVSYSCGECHRRKQKCDRQMPCSHCIARKVPELCKAYTPGKTDQDVHARLARLEHVVESALPQYWSQSDPDNNHSEHFSVSPTLEDDARTPDIEDISGGLFASGKWYGSAASGSVAAPALLEQLEHMTIPGSDCRSPNHSLSLSTDHLATHLSFSETKTLLQPDCPEPSPADNLKSLVQNYGVPPQQISELLHDLPRRDVRDKLVDYYFSAINWTRYDISERDFRASYNSIVSEGGTINPNYIRFLPLLYVVLATSVKLAPEQIAGDSRSRNQTASRLYWCSRRSLLLAAAIQSDCFEMVLTRMLSARFLLCDRKMTESWSQLGAAVRTAQALGLHRDGATMGMDFAQVEYRRRIWSHLYHADRSYAMVLGRPIAIQDDYTSTLPPLNIESNGGLYQMRTPLPLSTPTNTTFMILRHSLARIMGRIVHHFQQVRTPSHYSDVLALDDELLNFMTSLPPHFAVEPDTSLDDTFRYIPVHRFLLVTEILFVRTTLNRPYLLRKLSTDRYMRSRKACFECAMKDSKIRRAFLATATKEVRDPLTVGYREFQSAMISGIYLVLYPRGPDADAMHSILDGYIRTYDGQQDMDETTRREVKIIKFLKSKASHMEASVGDRRPPGMHNGSGSSKMPHVDAHLLLNLKSNSVPSTPAPTPINTPIAGPSMSVKPAPFTMKHASQLQQLQHTESASQSASASPSADDESTAQSLLDQWCNVFSGGPNVDSSAASMPWGTPGLADFSTWLGPPLTSSPVIGNDMDPLPGAVDGSDWTYWESLVNQIRSGPVT